MRAQTALMAAGRATVEMQQTTKIQTEIRRLDVSDKSLSNGRKKLHLLRSS